MRIQRPLYGVFTVCFLVFILTYFLNKSLRWLNLNLGLLDYKSSLQSHPLWVTLYINICFVFNSCILLKQTSPFYPINKKFPLKEFRTFPRAVLSYINALYGTQFRFHNFIIFMRLGQSTTMQKIEHKIKYGGDFY